MLVQERQEAARLFGAPSEQQAADNTFEPGEGLPDNAAAEEQADGAASGAEEDEEQQQQQNGAAPKATAAPSAEQLTAVKAAVANAQTLQEAWALEQALKEGNMGAAYRVQAPQEVENQQQGDGATAMDEG
jgi:U2 small nuclear ribonucleoprotein A'